MENFNNNINNNSKQNNYKVLDGLRIFFYVIIINILASIVYTLIVLLLSLFYKGGYKEFASTPFAMYLGVIIIPITFFALFFIFNKINKINVKNALAPTKRFNAWSIAIVFGLCVAIAGFMPLINMLLSALNVGDSAVFPMNNWFTIILGLIGYALLPAVAEELLFRGIMLKGFSRRGTAITAVTITSLMFCLMHGGIQQTFYQVILGFVLGFVAYYTGNILFSVILHFLNNVMVVVFELAGCYNSFLGGFKPTFGGYMAAIGIAVAAAGLIVLLIWALKKINNSGELQDISFEGDTIIIEENTKKMSISDFVMSFDFNEKFYFYSGVIVALIIWLSNSI